MSREDYPNESVNAAVGQVFGNPVGRYVLDWLTEVYVNRSTEDAHRVVRSGAPTVERHLTWKMAQQDLVLTLRRIVAEGLPEEVDAPQHSEDNDE